MAFSVTVQVPVPGQLAGGLPLTVQPVNEVFAVGEAVSVIAVLILTVSEQSFPQVIPDPVTVPLPLFVTVRVR